MIAKEIQIVIGGLGLGGAERHLSYILPELVKRQFTVRILTLSSHVDLVPQLKEAGIEIDIPLANLFQGFPYIITRILKILNSLYRLYKSSQQYPYAINHFFLPEAYILGMVAALLVRFKGPLVMSRRSLNLYQQRRPGIKYIEKFLHRFTTFILGNSLSVVQELQNKENVPFEKLGLIYNGINTICFNQLKPTAVTREELQIDPDTLVLTIVANLIPYKGHCDLLEALALIKNQLPEKWCLLVIGNDTGIQEELANYTVQLGIHAHIRWMGSRTDVADIYSASDMGILSSHEEGFSNAILEGMAAGLPMVVTDVGGNSEAVINEETGFVVPARDPKQMSKQILRLALDSKMRASMGQKAKIRLEQHFSLEACVNRYESFYTAILANQLPSKNAVGEINITNTNN